MKLENLKDLEALVKLCRKVGIEAMEVGEIKFNLGPAPKSKVKPTFNDIPEANIKIPQFNPIASNEQVSTQDVIKTDALSEEALLFYSVEGESN